MSTPKGATKDRPQVCEALHVHDAVEAERGINVNELMAEITDAIREPRDGAE